MKKFIFGAAMMLASVTAMAQAYVGGGIGFSRNTTDNVTEFSVVPEVGFNINEKWAAGASLDYSYVYNSGLKVNAFEIAPYARYKYFNYDRVHLFVDGGFGIGFGKSKFEDYSGDTIVLFQIGFKPGVAFDVTDKFGLVAHFGFLGYQGGNDASADVRPERVGFDFSSMNLQFGFYYNF